MSTTIPATGSVDYIKFVIKGKERDKVVARVAGGEWILFFVFLIARELSLLTGQELVSNGACYWSWRRWKGE